MFVQSYAAALPPVANGALFVLLAAGVWLAGARLTYLADTLADRLKLARSLMGLLVLSLATSLPEVATTLGAALRQNRELVLNNLFGGIALQTAILALGDIWARGAITNYPRKANHALEAALLVILLGLMLAITAVNEPLSILHLGAGSIVVGGVYVAAVILLRRYDAASDWVPVDLPPAPEDSPAPLQADPGSSLRALVIQALLACAAILVLGLALVGSAELLAVQTGLGASFVGVSLLAAATSLPELTTTITAVRMGAYTMAISNIFGSNLIMLVLVLPADMLYLPGPILRDTGAVTQLAVASGIVVTGIYLAGLLVRRKPRVGPVGLDSALVLAVYGLSLLALYAVR